MTYDETRAEAKRRELRILMADALARAGGAEGLRVADIAADQFFAVTAPYSGSAHLEEVRMRPGGLGGASSVKPGNVFLNLRKLIIAIANGTITVAGTMVTPWLAVLGALVVWDSLSSCLQLEIGDTQASVLWGMWVSRDAKTTVAKDEVATCVNRERARFERVSLGQGEIDLALEQLLRMGCIAHFANDPSRYWLREWVSVGYD